MIPYFKNFYLLYVTSLVVCRGYELCSHILKLLATIHYLVSKMSLISRAEKKLLFWQAPHQFWLQNFCMEMCERYLVAAFLNVLSELEPQNQT